MTNLIAQSWFEWRKPLHSELKGKKCGKMTNVKTIYVKEKYLTLGVCLILPRDYIKAFGHYFQISPILKPPIKFKVHGKGGQKAV